MEWNSDEIGVFIDFVQKRCVQSFASLLMQLCKKTLHKSLVQVSGACVGDKSNMVIIISCLKNWC